MQAKFKQENVITPFTYFLLSLHLNRTIVRCTCKHNVGYWAGISKRSHMIGNRDAVNQLRHYMTTRNCLHYELRAANRKHACKRLHASRRKSRSERRMLGRVRRRTGVDHRETVSGRGRWDTEERRVFGGDRRQRLGAGGTDVPEHRSAGRLCGERLGRNKDETGRREDRLGCDEGRRRRRLLVRRRRHGVRMLLLVRRRDGNCEAVKSDARAAADDRCRLAATLLVVRNLAKIDGTNATCQNALQFSSHIYIAPL